MRFSFEEYQKRFSATYLAMLDHSESMQVAKNTLLEQVGDRKNLRILEIGGGTGEIMQKLRMQGHQTVSVSNDERECVILQNNNIPFFYGDMHELGIYNQFDVVLISHVFEHSCAPFVLMVEINHWLKKGGIAIIIVPDQDVQWTTAEYHCIVPNSLQLQHLAKLASLEVLSCEEKTAPTTKHLVMIVKKNEDWNP